MKFECHVTINPGPQDWSLIRDIIAINWTHSQIHGDPQLGNGIRHYATKYFEQKDEAILGTLEAVKKLTGKGYTVIRYKVEEVVYDSRG